MYANDTQIYVAFEISSSTGKQVAIETIQACISEIRPWILLNKLQLNDGKTEFLLISTPHLRKLLSTLYISVGATDVLTRSARNLGVIFDEHMNLESHVKNMRCSCFQHLKWISDIRKYITADSAKQLVHAFVTSRLDNGNSLLYGLPSSVIHKLQMVQHAAARVITRTRKFNSITPVLKELHWLPVHRGNYFQTFSSDVSIAPYEVMHLNICHLYCAVINHHGLCAPLPK